MKQVVVAMGGPSGEYEVSLNSGRAVLKGLQAEGYSTVPMWISKDLRVSFTHPDDPSPHWLDLAEGLLKLKALDPYVVFVAMHGPFGEDGVFQSILQSLELPFTGSDHYGCAMSMDKIASRAIYASAGIPQPAYMTVESSWVNNDLSGTIQKIESSLGLPVVLKTPRLGSSVGVLMAGSRDQLAEGLKELSRMDGRILCEQYIRGRELTVPVLEMDDGSLKALPVIEVVVKHHDFFDYESKYDPELAEEIVPAPIPQPWRDRLQELGMTAHNILNLKGFSRTDFIVDSDGKPYILETNAIPGLTDVSLVPKAAKAAGIPFPRLLALIVENARREFFKPE